MAKNKSSFVIIGEYVSVLFFFKLIRVLPYPVCQLLARILGWLLWLCLPKRRKIIQKNLLIAFPDMPYTIRKKLEHAFWPEFCIMVFLYCKYAYPPPHLYESVIQWENTQFYTEAKKEHKGIIVFGAHFSNWELLGTALSSKGYATATVARPLDNPKLNQFIDRIRASSNLKVIPHRNAVKEALKILRNASSIGFVMDQNFHHGGVFVNFFKKQASMTDLPAVLSIKTGAPLVPAHIWRNGQKFHIRFDKPIIPKEGETSQDISQKIADVMEGWIKEKPLYWLWAHDRWKRQPV